MADVKGLRGLGPPPGKSEARHDLVPQDDEPIEHVGLLREATAIVAAIPESAHLLVDDGLPSELQFVADEKPRLKPMNLRVPEDLAEGLRQMAIRSRRPAQDILTEWMADGLNRWHPDWRIVLPKRRGG